MTSAPTPGRGPAAPTARADYPPVPEGTPVYTRWVWWVVLLPFAPILPLIGYFAELPARMVEFMRWSLETAGPGGRADPAYAGWRRSGRGLPTLWTTIALFAASIILGIVGIAWLTSTLAGQLGGFVSSVPS